MNKAIKNIALILMVAMVILATGGFSIYHHICHCAGDMTASLFIEANCDHEDSSSSTCCDLNEDHSCCSEKHEATCHENNCCESYSQFFKINDSFQPKLEKISLKPFYVISVLLDFDISAYEYAIPSLKLFNADLPPPDKGKQIILALHQLKLDPSLV